LGRVEVVLGDEVDNAFDELDVDDAGLRRSGSPGVSISSVMPTP
jgi:hypothetical protein